MSAEMPDYNGLSSVVPELPSAVVPELENDHGSWASRGDDSRMGLTTSMSLRSATVMDMVMALQELEPLTDQEAALADMRKAREVQIDSCAGMNVRVNYVRKFWHQRAENHASEAQRLSQLMLDKQHELNELIRTREESEVPPPPGPKCLTFVMGSFTRLCVAIVIAANIVTAGVQVLHPQLAGLCSVAEQWFLLFYVLELTLKLCLFQKRFLCGHLSEIWSNWLQVAVVVTMAIVQWLIPLFAKDWHNSAVANVLNVFRLVMVGPILRDFQRTDVSWIEDKPAQLFMSVVIAINAVVMGLESDYGDWSCWVYVEQIILLIFVGEIVLRLKTAGWGFFCYRRSDAETDDEADDETEVAQVRQPKTLCDIIWNYLDFLLVLGGVVDEWLFAAINVILIICERSPVDTGRLSNLMMTLRMSRLLRLLRLVRFVRHFHQLYDLVVGLVRSLQSISWTLLVTLFFLYLWALLCVKLVGHGLAFGGHDQVEPEVADIFPNVPMAFFVCFETMMGTYDDLHPLLQYRLAQPVFALFVIVSNWAIFAIFTAVICDNMFNSNDDNRQELDKEERDKEKDKKRHWLKCVFIETDEDETKSLTREELDAVLTDQFRKAEVCKASELQPADLQELFSLLTIDDNAIVFDQFIKGLLDEGKPVHASRIMCVESRLLKLEEDMGELVQNQVDLWQETELSTASYEFDLFRTGADVRLRGRGTCQNWEGLSSLTELNKKMKEKLDMKFAAPVMDMWDPDFGEWLRPASLHDLPNEVYTRVCIHDLAAIESPA